MGPHQSICSLYSRFGFRHHASANRCDWTEHSTSPRSERTARRHRAIGNRCSPSIRCSSGIRCIGRRRPEKMSRQGVATVAMLCWCGGLPPGVFDLCYRFRFHSSFPYFSRAKPSISRCSSWPQSIGTNSHPVSFFNSISKAASNASLDTFRPVSSTMPASDGAQGLRSSKMLPCCNNAPCGRRWALPTTFDPSASKSPAV